MNLKIKKVYINLLTPLFMIALIVIDRSIYPLVMFACAILHEAGHYAAMKMCGVEIYKIVFYPFIIYMDYNEKSLVNYKAEIITAVCGPLMNFLVIIILLAVSRFYSFFGLPLIVFGNFFIMMFNLMPVEGFDGGRILKAIVSLKFEYTFTVKICNIVSFIFIVILFLAGIYLFFITEFNISVLIIMIFVSISKAFAYIEKLYLIKR